MTSAYRILWGEGMFLRPQHFQQQAIHHEWLISQSASLQRAYAFGIKSLRVDETAITIGTFRLEAITAILPDGTLVDIPGNAPAPLMRDLRDIPGIGTETVVYVGLPALNVHGGNSAESGESVARPVRYVVESARVPDLFTSGLETDLSILQHQVVLLTENENRDGYFCLPIAKVILTPSGVWSLSTQYIPPLLDIHGSEIFLGIIRRLIDMLFVKSQALAGTHRERSKNVVEYSTSDISSFWLLHTVNRSFPVLSHLLKAPLAHPEQLYLALAELNGELMTFSSSASLHEIPAYAHDNLIDTFLRLEGSIHALLDTVISSRYLSIPLINTRPSFFVGRLESDNLLENIDFYLSVESRLPATHVIETVPLKLKVGSPEDVEKILNSALPGVRLTHAPQTPSAIPVRIGNIYFAIEHGGQIYERMKASRSICLYVPTAMQDMKIELIAVFR